MELWGGQKGGKEYAYSSPYRAGARDKILADHKIFAIPPLVTISTNRSNTFGRLAHRVHLD